jgi:hypothetical protein
MVYWQCFGKVRFLLSLPTKSNGSHQSNITLFNLKTRLNKEHSLINKKRSYNIKLICSKWNWNITFF